MHWTAAAGFRYLTLRLAVAVTSCLAVVSLAGCGATSDPSPAASVSASSGPIAVSIRNFAFGPPSITVHVGTTVTWTNQDPQPTHHTATADGGAFNTGSLEPGQSGAFTFTNPGRYAYHCAIHNYMTGVIVVEP